jgi:hypothetical protein
VKLACSRTAENLAIDREALPEQLPERAHTREGAAKCLYLQST